MRVEPPFSEEGNVEENQLFRLEEVDAATAEEMLKEYFSGEHVRSVTRAGETVTREIACYNFLIERKTARRSSPRSPSGAAGWRFLRRTAHARKRILT